MNHTAPASTYVLIGSILAAFCAFGSVVIFLPAWEWYLIPLACAVPALVVLAQRWVRHRAAHRELQATLEQLG